MLKERLTQLKFHPAVLAARQLRKSLADAYPTALLKLSSDRRRALSAEFKLCSDVAGCMEFTQRNMRAGSCQIPSEIESALAFMGEAKPKILCEIGTFDGGTSLLFSRFLPSVEAMLCIDLYVKNKAMIRLLAPPGQRVDFVDGPSYASATVERAKRWLDGRRLDVLFIDGDHRYEGVRKDFELYSPMVREGGLIFFHDIIEDRGGARAWAGGVPQIWKELRNSYPSREFVHRAEQAGYGIGALTWSSAPR